MLNKMINKINEMRMEKAANRIMNTIRNNKRFEKIQYTYDKLSEKYGEIVIAGGSLVDCYFDKEFYDIDIFIAEKDLNPEFRQPHRSENNILYVIRDILDGEAIDIVVVNYKVSEHIKRFDQNFKKIYFNGQLHIKKAAVKDLMKNEITMGSMGGPVNYFRLLKSAKKYNMKYNEDDLYILYNFASYLKYLGRLRVADKYAENLKEFHVMPAEQLDSELAKKTYEYAKSYWKTDVKFVDFQTFKQSVLNK